MRQRLRFAVGLAVGLSAAGILSTAAAAWYVWGQLPAIDALASYQAAEPLRIYSADGELLAQYGPERREVWPLTQIPPTMRAALLAIEDARFYTHGAVDYAGIGRAALANIFTGRQGQGGSTITMQVARNFYLTREKTWSRKFAEILLAYKLESRFGKDRLLELYMNEIYLGERAYGFAAAAHIYFGKSLSQLTLAESALLAGLPKAPSAYNPMINPDRARQRQRYILQRMLALGNIDAEAYRQALAQPLALAARGSNAVREAAYAVEQARLWAMERYGDDTYSRGLNLYLTLDMPKQRAADAALREELIGMQNDRGYLGPEGQVALPHGAPRSLVIRRALAMHPDSGALKSAIATAVGPQFIDVVLSDGKLARLKRHDLQIGKNTLSASQIRKIREGSVLRVSQSATGSWALMQLPAMEGALASLDTDSGAIVALVGGFDYQRNKYDHAIQAYRQPGSAFKPFVYSAALEKGYFPDTEIDDSQRLLNREETGASPWKPRNFNHRYDGFVSIRSALTHSKNMATVSLMQAAGAQYVQEFTTHFGFESKRNPPSLPLALGAGGVTPLQLAAAFNVFASGGWHRQPYLVAQVSDRAGVVLYDGKAAAAGASRRVISARNAWLSDSLLRSVVNEGSGRSAQSLQRGDLAGKTGTSNNARDAWFGGYGGGIVTTVWVGYDQPKSLGNRSGAIYALPIWKRYMTQALQDRPEQIPAMPEGLAHDGDDYVYSEYLQGKCMAESSPFVRSRYQCTAAQYRELAETAAGILATQSDANERARIIEMFSSSS
ncbi:MAG: Multimodular transpeptidase-transglycosylase [Herbaspirillum sp.]|nr:Multimodular transpeptidase-transglycosylase [Herbaspirillum sp.]